MQRANAVRATTLLLAFLTVCVLPARGAAAQSDAKHEAACERMATSAKKRTIDDFRTMAADCALAAARHKTLATRARGAQHQQELILEATYLYFEAEGQVLSKRTAEGVSTLQVTRKLYQDVYDYALTPEFRSKAKRGLDVVNEALGMTPGEHR